MQSRRNKPLRATTIFSIAYKYNLLIVLKILSYTLYRKQLEEIERRAFGKIEQDS